MTVDGVRMPIASVFATSSGGRAFTLHFGTLPITCADALQNGYSPRPGELRFDVTVSPIVGDGGALDWHVQGVGFFSNDMRMGAPAVVEEADASPGGRVRVRLRAETESFVPDGFRLFGPGSNKRLVVAGAVEAAGCGVLRIHSAPLRPQPVLFEAGSARVSVGCATVTRRTDGDFDLLLQNGACDCWHDVPAGDAALSLRIGASDMAVRSVHLMGDIIPNQRSASVFDYPRPASPMFVTRPAGPLDGDGVVDIQVGGTMVLGPVRVTLSGTARALRCAGLPAQ